MVTCVILGSAFGSPTLAGMPLRAEHVTTRFGDVTLHRLPDAPDAFVLFRHGLPHQYPPHQIPYKAHAEALRKVGCGALLITSSVGVLDPRVPLFTPLLGGDLLMLDNRMPDGSMCTLFATPESGQGHLLIEDGVFSTSLGAEVERLAERSLQRVVFAYVAGPRTKTAVENRVLVGQGAQVNSMTVGPEAVLAAELGIPVAGLFVGHQWSGARDADVPDAPPRGELADTLSQARQAMERIAVRFLTEVLPVKSANGFFQFGEQGRR